MTCLEAQSKIIAYIEKNIERTDKLEFLKHVKSCKDCREELHIYYTMIEGMRQLDDNEVLSKDFSKDLEDRMDRDLNSDRTKKKFVRSTIVLFTFLILSFVVFGYVNFLRILEEQEQQKIKDAQGQYYYSETFDDILFAPLHEPMLNINIEPVKEEEPTFYERVKQYEYNKK